MKKIFTVALLALIFFPIGSFADAILPSNTSSANLNLSGQLVPDDGSQTGADYNFCTLRDVANNIINFAVILSVFVATLMFAYGGILYVTASGAGEEQLKKAHSVFTSVFVGLVVILIAWLIVNIVLSVLTGGNLSSWTNWFTSGGAGCSKITSQAFSQVQDVQHTTPGNNNNAPAGSCVSASQAAAQKYGSTSSCHPQDRVASYGNGASVVSSIKSNYGSIINSCASEQGIPPNVLVGIAGLECAGKSTCNDPAANGCLQGGYGATGVSCSEVRSYCSHSTNSVCSGVSGSTDGQLISNIQTHPNLAYCASAYTMKNNYNQYGDWGNAAVAYNGGAGALAASSACPGYLAMQCPVYRGSSQFPYCQITCAYHDSFDNYVISAGGYGLLKYFNMYVAAADAVWKP